MSINFVKQICIVYIVYFELGRFLLEHKYILKFLKIIEIFDANLVFFPVSNFFGRKIVLNDIFEASIVP